MSDNDNKFSGYRWAEEIDVMLNELLEEHEIVEENLP